MNKKTFAIAGILIILLILIVYFSRQYFGKPFVLIHGSPTVSLEPTLDLIDQANQFILNGQDEQAFQTYTSAIQSGTDLAEAYAGRGNINMKWRKFAEAEQDYSASLKLREDKTILASRCNSYRLLAQYTLAQKDCDEAIKLDPKSIDGYLALAFLYLEQGDLQNAQISIEKCLEINPDSDQVYYALSQIQLNQNNTEGALKSLTKAIEINPNEPRYYWDRGFMYYSTGKLHEAKSDLKKVIDIGNPANDGEVMYQAGNLLNSMQGVP